MEEILNIEVSEFKSKVLVKREKDFFVAAKDSRFPKENQYTGVITYMNYKQAEQAFKNYRV